MAPFANAQERGMVATSSSSVLDGPTTYLLAVGVADFKHLSPDFDLRYAEADASAFTEGLASALGKSLPRSHITVLVGDDATFERVNAALRETLAAADEDDTVILFFSTHGVLSGDEGYLLTWDTTPNERLPYTSLPTKDIVNAVNRSRAAHVLLFTDACHAGITGAGTKGASVPSFDPSRIQVDHRSFFNQASSTIMQPSLEGPQYCGGHGAYTCALLMAMQGAVDRDSDGVVSLRELQIYVPPIVDSLTNGNQSPETKGRFDSQYVFVQILPNSRDGNELEEYGAPLEDSSPSRASSNDLGDALREYETTVKMIPTDTVRMFALPPALGIAYGSTLWSLGSDSSTQTSSVRWGAALSGVVFASMSAQHLAVKRIRKCQDEMGGFFNVDNERIRIQCGPEKVGVFFSSVSALIAYNYVHVLFLDFTTCEPSCVSTYNPELFKSWLLFGIPPIAASLLITSGQYIYNARLIPGVSTPGTSALPRDPTQPMWAQAGWSPMGLTVVGTF